MSTVAAERTGTDQPRYAIRPSHGLLRINLHELWRYRELAFFFVWRDIKVRYKQTLIGVAWVVIQPFANMILYTVVFGNLAKLPSDDKPYATVVIVGLLAWTYFANAVVSASNVIVDQGRLITKVYFPRLLLPVSSVLSGLVDFGVVFVVALVILASFGIFPGFAIFALPLFLLLAVATALAIGLWLSALNALYRDVRYVLPFLIQFGVLASPVGYLSHVVSDRVPGWLFLIYSVNPMVGVINGFRWALLGTPAPAWSIGISVAVVLGLLVGGAFYFRRMERHFADLV